MRGAKFAAPFTCGIPQGRPVSIVNSSASLRLGGFCFVLLIDPTRQEASIDS
jgi:hypothetical protein